MKIYFLGTFRKVDEIGDAYRQIVQLLEEEGHSVIYDHILMEPEKIKELTDEECREYFRKMQRRIKSADAMVAEVTLPTVNVGYEIAYALEKGKPVLLLRDKTKPLQLGTIFRGNTMEKFVMREYDNENLAEVVQEGITELKNLLDVRYNFFISKEIVDYLNHIAKKRRTPRSVYLRNLVEADMKADREYQGQVSEEFERNRLE